MATKSNDLQHTNVAVRGNNQVRSARYGSRT